MKNVNHSPEVEIEVDELLTVLVLDGAAPSL